MRSTTWQQETPTSKWDFNVYSTLEDKNFPIFVDMDARLEGKRYRFIAHKDEWAKLCNGLAASMYVADAPLLLKAPRTAPVDEDEKRKQEKFFSQDIKRDDPFKRKGYKGGGFLGVKRSRKFGF